MDTKQEMPIKMPFSKEEIGRQLKKIFEDKLFVESAILKRFLEFIVNETIDGNDNCLKEYTIAVKVLGKPLDFKPNENGIVRIHAGRLRRALSYYYNTKGESDPIFISIPKGKYVPTFSERKNTDKSSDGNLFNSERLSLLPHEHSLVVAVLPFRHSSNNAILKSFSDGVGMQLSTTLMHIKNVSVVAHQAIRSLTERIPDFTEITRAIGSVYLITGDMQMRKNQLRVNLQMIRTSNCEQIWGEVYEQTLTDTTFFKLQDEIVALAVSQFVHFWSQVEGKKIGMPVLAAVS